MMFCYILEEHLNIEELDLLIAKYDLLRHPFYKAWSAGELTHEDLCEYACDYYHHVKAFPSYLAQFAARLENSELRNAVVGNMMDEEGTNGAEQKRSHADLWLDFAEGMGANRDMLSCPQTPEMTALIHYFSNVAQERSPEEALAVFFVYESQVPRLAEEKARGLRLLYGADDKTCSYFTLHTSADVYHARVWRQQLTMLLKKNPRQKEAVLATAEGAAKALWCALDGIEQRRLHRALSTAS